MSNYGVVFKIFIDTSENMKYLMYVALQYYFYY